MNQNLLSSLKKIYDAQLTYTEKYAIIQELNIKEVKPIEISKITGMSKGRISQIKNAEINKIREIQHPKPECFDFYTWLEIGATKLCDKDTIPLTDKQKREVEILILKLKRIRGKITEN